jgi:hypothetical protein
MRWVDLAKSIPILAHKTCYERVQKAVPPGEPGPTWSGNSRKNAIESLACDGHQWWPLSFLAPASP